MPVYTYRREDGTTFDYRQKFVDDPLTVDPETGQHVTRVIQPAGVIFKGSGFYINDSKSASHSTIGTPKSEKGDKSETPSAEKSDSSEKSEKKDSTVSKPAVASTEAASKAPATAAAD